jgi:hypothetical protein
MNTISKTDFMQYLDQPMHLWAIKHDQAEKSSYSEYDRFLMEQGGEVERVAKDYFQDILFADSSKYEVKTEQTFTSGSFINRADILVYDIEAATYDVYEVKSSTSFKKEHKYEITYQHIVMSPSIPIRGMFLVHLNKEYQLGAKLDLSQLFVIEDASEAIKDHSAEVKGDMEAALELINSKSTDGFEACRKPSACICPSLCHPNLPKYSIYELSRLHKNKARQLRTEGIFAIKDIDPDFKLSDRQSLQRQAVLEKKAQVNQVEISSHIGQLEYPLAFLDYETLGFAIPIIQGYKPQQSMVFQYSLHIKETAEADVKHIEYLVTEKGDPSRMVADHLGANLPKKGSVIVWNKGFEGGRNTEMGIMFPDLTEFFNQVNVRLYDLMEIFSKSYYVHHDFQGSASLKKVLPVLLPELGGKYEEINVSEGSEAMLAWESMMWGNITGEQKQRLIDELLEYCELDTFAMVEILRWLKML